MLGAIVYLLAIILGEVVAVFFMPLWGITIHILVLTALIVHSSLLSGQPYQRLFLSLALVPLVRIMWSLPLGSIPQIWWYPIIYAPLLAASVVVMRLSGYRATDIGLNFSRPLLQLPVALTGFVFGVVEYLILAGEAEATYLIFQGTELLAGFLLVVCTGFTEELIFRGVIQRSAVPLWGWWGIIYVSLLFTALHLLHNSAIDLVFVFLIAVFFAWIVKRTGSLLGVIVSHGITNLVLYLIMPTFF